MLEIARRLILLAGVVGGVAMAGWLTTDLLSVEPVDWLRTSHGGSRRSAAIRRALETAEGPAASPVARAQARQQLEQFITETTKGRLQVVRGPAWEGFFHEAAEAVTGTPADAGWQARRAREGSSPRLYFRPDEVVLVELPAPPRGEGAVLFVRVDGRERSEYLAIAPVDRREAAHRVPAHLAYPWRHAACHVLLLTVLLHGFLPRPRAPRIGLTGASPTRIFFSDWAGAGLVGFFVWLWVLLTTGPDTPGSRDLAGWAIVTLICAGFVLVSATILAVTTSLALRRLEVVDDVLVSRTLLGSTCYPIRDIERLEVAAVEMPLARKLRTVGLLVGLFRWRALGPALLLQVSEDRLKVVLKDGTVDSLPVGGEGLAGLVRALRSRRVAIDASVEPYLAEETSGGGSSRAITLTTALLAGLAGAGLVTSKPPPAPIVTAGALPDTPYRLPRPREIDPARLAERRRLLADVGKEHERIQNVGQQLHTASPEKRPALHTELRQALARMEHLLREHDRLDIYQPAPGREAPGEGARHDDQ